MLDMRTIWDKMVDFRRKITASLRIRPSDSKEKDFHLALADYLYKELKAEKFSVSKHDVMVKVRLEKAYQERYNHIVIDCHAGKMYLRGKDVSDRYFGRLRRFEGSRASDAYHCVSQSSTRIINRIKSIMISDTIEVLAETERMDMRKSKIVATDMRKKIISTNCMDMRKTASLKDARKQKTLIEVRDHRTLFSWLQNGRVVASGFDNRIKKVVERIDVRKAR